MEVKNGIIIDGVLHELQSGDGCNDCSLFGVCYDDFSGPLCDIVKNPDGKLRNIFVNRGKVKVEKEETE